MNIETARLQNQLDAVNWLIDQTHDDGMGELLRYWLLAKRKVIAGAGGTPKKGTT